MFCCICTWAIHILSLPVAGPWKNVHVDMSSLLLYCTAQCTFVALLCYRYIYRTSETNTPTKIHMPTRSIWWIFRHLRIAFIAKIIQWQYPYIIHNSNAFYLYRKRIYTRIIYSSDCVCYALYPSPILYKQIQYLHESTIIFRNTTCSTNAHTQTLTHSPEAETVPITRLYPKIKMPIHIRVLYNIHIILVIYTKCTQRHRTAVYARSYRYGIGYVLKHTHTHTHVHFIILSKCSPVPILKVK